MTPARRISPRAAYRLMQREQVEASGLMAKKFPRLKALILTVE